MKGIKFNYISRWSNIARFGSSNLARMTIVAPFIAFIVLLNEPVKQFLVLTPASTSSGFWAALVSSRLELFYLGLVFVGAAVAIFSLLAPDQIVRNISYNGFIKIKEKTKTDYAVVASLEETIDTFMEASDPEEQSPFFSPNSTEFPRQFRESLFRLVEGIFEDIMPDIRDDDFPEDFAEFFTGTGHLATDQVLDILTNRRRVQWVVWKTFYSNTSANSIDVFRLEYLRNDYSKPLLRKALFILISVGTGVLLLPTVITTALVIKSILHL